MFIYARREQCDFLSTKPKGNQINYSFYRFYKNPPIQQKQPSGENWMGKTLVLLNYRAVVSFNLKTTGK